MPAGDRSLSNVSLLGDSDEARKKKLDIARKAKLPVHKLLAAVTNEELRSRLESQWQNTAVLSAFIASISIACCFTELDVDDSDPEQPAKQVVRSLFYTSAALSSILLLLATILLIENLTTLTLIPMNYVDDLLYKMGVLESVPSVCTVVALVLLIALFPLYMFILFGQSWEFFVILIFTCVCTVFGFAYFAYFTQMQAQFLDRYLHVHTVTESGRPPAIVELAQVTGPI